MNAFGQEICISDKFPRVLFENRPALYCNYKENETNNTRMQDTLFIDDFIDIMEQYFLY